MDSVITALTLKGIEYLGEKFFVGAGINVPSGV